MTSVLAAPISLFLGLYTLALLTSMSGMEIFGWGTALFTLLTLVFKKQNRNFQLFYTGLEIPLLLYLIIVYLGLYINAPEIDPLYAMGQQRWIILMFLLMYAFEISGGINRSLNIFIGVGTLIGAYAIFQHFTGIDIIRGDNRAVTPAPFTNGELYQSVGFLSHHLTYGYSFAQIICFPFAALLLGNYRSRWMSFLFLLSTTIIGLSLFWTYGRGVWIAVACSFLVMTAYVSRKTLVGFLIAAGILGFAAYQYNSSFQQRLDSIWASKYQSNDDRRDIWKANLEMFKDHPWIGIGFGVNEVKLHDYFDRMGIQNEFNGHAHNNYLQALSTTGFLGFSMYMIFILLLLLITNRLWLDIPETHFWHRVLALGALGSQVSLHIGGLTQWNFGDAEVNHLFIFIAAMVLYSAEHYRRGIVPDDYAL